MNRETGIRKVKKKPRLKVLSNELTKSVSFYMRSKILMEVNSSFTIRASTNCDMLFNESKRDEFYCLLYKMTLMAFVEIVLLLLLSSHSSTNRYVTSFVLVPKIGTCRIRNVVENTVLVQLSKQRGKDIFISSPNDNRMVTYLKLQSNNANDNTDLSKLENDDKNTITKMTSITVSNKTNRRYFWNQLTGRQGISLLLGGAIMSVWVKKANANNNKQKSRTDNYSYQKSEQEWKEQLSSLQYYVLRQGGTERPGYSILEKEYRTGYYNCAGCKTTTLFTSDQKFSSGTGWPSFAKSVNDNNVEIEPIDVISSTLGIGAELRCSTCGGHLGDVFNDGFLFINTPAFTTGKRYCIDGSALVFYPTSTNNDTGGTSSTASDQSPISGDIPAKRIQTMNYY